MKINLCTKKTQQITKTNQVLQESENTLKAEINFLKEQVTALWQNTRHTSDEINQPDTTSASSVPSITSEKRPGTSTPSTTETSSPSITPNIPTENRFIPLRDHGESDNTSNSRQDIDVVNNTATTSPKTNPPNQRGNGIPTQPPSFPAVVDKCVFLCDSNGKFLDKKKLFPSGQDFTFFRCPTTTHARTILQDEINKEPEHPKLILFHSGTNDLTPTTLIDDFISEISVFITQVSTMFPKSKIIYSTLLPRADISLHNLSKINAKLFDSCSTLPNVHMLSHENIFSKGLDVLHDNKHLKKRHLGLFAANLVAAIRGRAQQPPRSVPSQPNRSSSSPSRSLYPKTEEIHAFPTNQVGNGLNKFYLNAETHHPPPSFRQPYTSSLEGYSSYSNAVKYGPLSGTNRPTYHTPQQQSKLVHAQNGPPAKANEHLVPNSSSLPYNDQSGDSKISGVEVPKELVSLLRFIKTLL